MAEHAPASNREDLETSVNRADTRSALLLAVGAGGLAMLACVPHWVAPTLALIVALVAIPIAWGFRRLATGRRRVQFVVVVLTLLLTVVLAVTMPIVWLQLGVLRPLELP